MGFESQNNLSLEQQERQAKFVELLEVMTALPDSFGGDSNVAFEAAQSIDGFKKDFEKDGLKLSDYLLGGVLLAGEENMDTTNYPEYDTEDGKIEQFIRSLENKQDMEIAA